MITVDVIIGTYNHERYIAQAIESALSQQTTFPVTIQVADDCSTDRTQEIVRNYHTRYPERISSAFDTKNRGLFDKDRMFLRLLRTTRADYVALLEGDDYWTDPHKLQKQVDFMIKNPDFSMCFSNSIVINENGNVIKSSRVPSNYKKNITQKDILDGFCPPSNTMLLKSEYLKPIIHLIGNRIINADYFISCLMAEYGAIGYIDGIMAAYRKHDKGIWSSSTEFERDTSLFNLFDTLANCINAENKDLVKNKAENMARKLQWAPQIAIFRSIKDLAWKIARS